MRDFDEALTYRQVLLQSGILLRLWWAVEIMRL